MKVEWNEDGSATSELVRQTELIHKNAVIMLLHAAKEEESCWTLLSFNRNDQ